MAVAFSSDGKRVLSGGLDATVIFWNAENGKLLRRLEGHRTEIHSVAISPDGRFAISGGWADQVKAASQPFVADPENCVACVWDLQSGKLLRRLIGHEGAINGVAFSPDGRYALSGSGGQYVNSTLPGFRPSRDNTVRLWDVHSGREVCRFTGHPATAREWLTHPTGDLSCPAESTGPSASGSCPWISSPPNARRRKPSSPARAPRRQRRRSRRPRTPFGKHVLLAPPNRASFNLSPCRTTVGTRSLAGGTEPCGFGR